PATKQFKLVPPSHQPAECNTPPEGFGYDPVREDYKVLRVAEYPLCFEGNWVWLPDANNHLWEMNELLDEILDNDDEFWDGWPLNMYDPFWEIYSLKSNSWKKIEGFDVPRPWGGSSQVNLNEFCHWLGPQGELHVKESWTKFSIVGPLTCSVMRPIGAGKKSHIFFRKKDDELA
ncbi:F-box protein, partial [Trifolium medium]|nr:F-box protein [Trifolium medium]